MKRSESGLYEISFWKIKPVALMLKTAPAEHQGKKSELSISFSEAGRFLGRLTDLVSLIKNFFFSQFEHQQEPFSYRKTWGLNTGGSES